MRNFTWAQVFTVALGLLQWGIAIVSVAGATIPATIAWFVQLRYKEDPAPWTRVYFWTVLVAVPFSG